VVFIVSRRVVLFGVRFDDDEIFDARARIFWGERERERKEKAMDAKDGVLCNRIKRYARHVFRVFMRGVPFATGQFEEDSDGRDSFFSLSFLRRRWCTKPHPFSKMLLCLLLVLTSLFLLLFF